MDFLTLALALHDRAGDGALALHQLDDRTVQPQFDAALLGGEGEGGDQAVAIGEARAAIVVQPVDRIAHRHARDVQRRSRRARHLEHMGQVVAAEHHAAERHHRAERRSQLVEPLAEPPAIERERQQRAAALRRTGLGRMIVRPDRHGLVTHMRVVLDEFDGRVAVVEERAGQFEVQAIAGLVLKIGERVFLGVGDAQRAAMAVGRNPDDAGRIGGRPAELPFLFDHQHIEAGMRGRESGGETGGAGSDDQQVGFDHEWDPPAPPDWRSRFSSRRRRASLSSASARAGMCEAIS